MSSIKEKLHHENWPTPVFYAPVFLYYLYNSVKFRKLNYFTAVNPALETGGLCGFSKYASFKILPQRVIPKTILLSNDVYSEQQLSQLLDENNLNFPLVVKPDQGERGFLVSKVDSLRELSNALGNKSLKLDFLIQEFVPGPLELGVFILRRNNKWQVSSITSKTFLSVTGDGQSTIQELAKNNDRVQKYYKSSLKSAKVNIYAVPKKGEKVLLEPIGNHCRGTEFINECDKIDDAINDVFVDLLKDVKGVNYSRLDIRTPSWDALKEGDFKVMEINGVSAEPGHIYDSRVPITKAYKDLFSHWSTMAQIAKNQMESGERPEKFFDTLGLVRQHMKRKKELLDVKSSIVEVVGCGELDLSLKPEEMLEEFSTEELLEKHVCTEAIDGYERTVLFQNKDYEIVLCHWRSGEKSAVHTHPNQNCWFKCLKGNMIELRSMGQERNQISVGQVGYIDDSMGAHQMLNLTDHCAYSLHIYQTIKESK